MTEEIKAKLAKLKNMKSDTSPRILEINEKREEEIAEVNKKYDHLVEDVSIEVDNFEKRILGELVDLFIDTIMKEFDAKRSTSEYMLTEHFRNFRDNMAELDLFPKELIEKMDKVIDGEPIDSLAYDIDKIEKQYKSK